MQEHESYLTGRQRTQFQPENKFNVRMHGVIHIYNNIITVIGSIIEEYI